MSNPTDYDGSAKGAAKYAQKTLLDIWRGLTYAITNAPVPVVFLALWISFLIWAMCNY